MSSVSKLHFVSDKLAKMSLAHYDYFIDIQFSGRRSDASLRQLQLLCTKEKKKKKQENKDVMIHTGPLDCYSERIPG